jgi:uncharacterized protein YggE
MSFLLMPVPAAAQQVKEDTPVVVAAGEGKVLAAPDEAYVSLSAESRAKNPKDAQKVTAQAMTAVHQRLTQAGLSKEAIRTLAYDVQPEFDWAGGKQTLRGYVARNTIEVRLDGVDRVGEIVDLAIAAGATAVSHIRFDIKERAALEREALKRAAADALARAEAAAAGAGRAIARVIKIEEQGTQVMPPRPMMTMRADMAAEPAQTPVSPGRIELNARVTITAALK